MLEFPIHVSCVHYIRVQNQKQNPHIILTNIIPKKYETVHNLHSWGIHSPILLWTYGDSFRNG